MAEEPDLVPGALGVEQLVVEPLQLVVGVLVVVAKPAAKKTWKCVSFPFCLRAFYCAQVERVSVHGVHGDEAETVGNGRRVVSAQPATPFKNKIKYRDLNIRTHLKVASASSGSQSA